MCDRIFLGTDSAPHAIEKKESGCGCAGCFSAHTALELGIGEFAGAATPADKLAYVERLQAGGAVVAMLLSSLPSVRRLLPITAAPPVEPSVCSGSGSVEARRAAAACSRWSRDACRCNGGRGSGFGVAWTLARAGLGDMPGQQPTVALPRGVSATSSKT